jgi:hypothetical protein
MKYYYYRNHFGGGLCNQFLFLMDHLIAIHRTREPSIVFLNSFKDDFHSNDMCSPFSNIIDIHWLNTVVFPNIYIIDLYSVSSDVTFGWVVHGVKHQLDTNLLLPLIKDNQAIYDVYPTLVDPAYTTVKPFWIAVESKQIYTEFNELCGRILDIQFSNQNGKGIFILHDDEFRHLFRYIPFMTKPRICGMSLWNYNERNVIHIRNEEDSIGVWGLEKNIPVDIYESTLNNKYINTIQDCISKDSINIILTARKEHNPVIEWMTTNGYQIYIPFHIGYQHQREQLAIRDLQIATEFGNHIFIGYDKSSFSLLLQLRFKGQSILIHYEE